MALWPAKTRQRLHTFTNQDGSHGLTPGQVEWGEVARIHQSWRMCDQVAPSFVSLVGLKET